MEFDAVQTFLENEREKRKTDRERDLERQLIEIADKYRRALVAESAPLYEELARIEAQKLPMPIILGDDIYEYAGPKPR